MTIAPCGVGVNAAHEPRPANGFSGIPSTLTATSVRAQAMRTTPSFSVVAFTPAAVPILPASRVASALASKDQPPTARIPTSRPPHANRLTQVLMRLLLSRTSPPGRRGTAPSPRPGLRAGLLPAHLEVVEVRLGVGLGPQP